MTNYNYDRALNLAAEYRRLNERGDIPLARQARQTIEDLGVGRFVDGKLVLPRPIAEAMGRPELAG